MVRQDDEFYEIKEGDLVWFKTGSAHQFYNHTDSTFLFFALSNNLGSQVFGTEFYRLAEGALGELVDGRENDLFSGVIE